MALNGNRLTDLKAWGENGSLDIINFQAGDSQSNHSGSWTLKVIVYQK